MSITFFGIIDFYTQEPHSHRVTGQMTAQRQGVAVSSASLICRKAVRFSVRDSTTNAKLSVLDSFYAIGGPRFVLHTL